MLQIQTFHPDGFPDTLEVDLIGKIDKENFLEIEEKLNPIMQQDDKRFYIFEFTYLEYVNNEIVDYLIHFINKEQKADNVVIFTGLKGQLKDVVDLFGIGKIAPIFKHPLEALQNIKKLKEEEQ